MPDAVPVVVKHLSSESQEIIIKAYERIQELKQGLRHVRLPDHTLRINATDVREHNEYINGLLSNGIENA